MEKNYVLLFLVLLTKFKYSLEDDPVIQIPNGQLLGREDQTIAGTSYLAFEKIPFGKPPVGELRFKAPQPVENWEGVYNASVLDVACYQIGSYTDTTESEDCLYLSVYTPKIPTEGNELLPVMLYIFGGAYVSGWSNSYKPDLLLDHGVIYVAINYRLGALGFLSTQDELIPGNNGLKDQLLALQWTHDNIKYFGGDPNRVTIFGQSAGAGSCAYQLLNPKAAGLFSGVILQSGTFLSPGSFRRNGREVALATAGFLNSTFRTNDNTQDLYDFLMSVDADDLKVAAAKYSNYDTYLYNQIVDQGSAFAPVVEVENPDAFLTEKMYVLLKEGNILAVPTLLGITSEEILLRIWSPTLLPNIMAIIDNHLGYLVPYDMRITDAEELALMGKNIRDIFTGGESFVDHPGGGVQYGSDQVSNRPIIRHAELYSSLAPTYFYQFSYDGEMGGFDFIVEGADTVAHLEDCRYLFCGGMFKPCDQEYPEADVLTRQRMLKIWTDFAKYRNPTPEPSELLQNITWPQVSVEDGDFLYVDIGENLEIKNHPKEKSYGKWVELYDSLGYDDFDTY